MRRGSRIYPRIAGLWVVALVGLNCSPQDATQDPGTTSPESATVDETPLESPESAEPAPEAEAPPPEASVEEPSAEEAAAVDTSIRDAAPFGDDALLEGLAPEGWHQAGDIEHYNVATLYDKINGRSELYMAYDVVGLSWVSFVHDDDPNLFMDVFVYDMRSPTGAFGIYSVERETGQPKVDIGREGYRTDSNYFFWKGKYYGYVQTSLDTEAAIDAGLEVARRVADRLDDSGEPVEGLDLVPEEGLVEDTVQYFRADAMSLDFMSDTFTAHYDVDGMDVTAFMTRRASEEEAVDIVEQYVGYLDEYGDDVQKSDVDGTEVILADLGGGYYDGVFRVGNVVAGVSAVEGVDATLAGAMAILQKFQ